MHYFYSTNYAMSTISKDFDLVVVGGGVLGAFHAYFALQKGLRVALIEKSSKPIGSTTQNFGQVVPSGMNLKWQAYGRKSLEIYKGLQQVVDISAKENGSIYFASNEEELQLINELHEINKANDYYSELLSIKQCLEKYPCLKTSYCVGGLYFPLEISVNPRELIYKVLDYLISAYNLKYFPNTLVKDIDSSDNDCKLRLADDTIFISKKVLVCSGTEFKTLYPTLFAQSDLELVKLQMLRLKPQEDAYLPGNILTGLSIRRYESFHECASFKAIKAKEDPQSFHKKWGVHILFKQEADGSVILGDSHEYADITKEADISSRIRRDINTYFINEGKKIMNLDHWSIDEEWVGYYSQCKESDLFQKTIDNKVHIVTGIGGKGMTASPGFAQENIALIYA